MSISQDRLGEVVEENPYPEFTGTEAYRRMSDQPSLGQLPWPMGGEFIGLISDSIVGLWRDYLGELGFNSDLEEVKDVFQTYMGTVYDVDVDRSIVEDFVVHGIGEETRITSSEFDALSFAFYFHVYEKIEEELSESEAEVRKYQFAVDVGERVFSNLESHLDFSLPDSYEDVEDLDEYIMEPLNTIGRFLHNQGYLGTGFDFSLDFEETDPETGDSYSQDAGDFLEDVESGDEQNPAAHGNYVMGMPSILPSAVYLFNIKDEAQHHSSRIIQEVFNQMGIMGKELDNFDPEGYDSEEVVEIWEFFPDS